MKHSNHIRKIREARGLSQEQLAQKINTTNPQISNLELGKRRLTWEWMQRIANALECHPFDLVDESKSASSSDEKDLLTTFRSLDPSQQEAVQKMVTFLHESKSVPFTPAPAPRKKK